MTIPAMTNQNHFLVEVILSVNGRENLNIQVSAETISLNKHHKGYMHGFPI